MVLRLFFGAALALLAMAGARSAEAACTVPNSFVNGATADAAQLNNNFTSILGCINASVGAPHTANLTSLKTLTGTTMIRDGFTTAGDGGRAAYNWTSAACTINAGAGDNGAQVAPAGGGCWTADFSSGSADVRIWGLNCDGTTSAGNSAFLTNALAAGVPLWKAIGTCLLDTSNIIVPTGSRMAGPGIYTGAAFKAANGMTGSYLFNVTATSNVDWEGIEIDGNKASTTTISCFQSALVTHLKLDLYIHDCPAYDALVGGTDVNIHGEYDNTTSGSGVALADGTRLFKVDIITSGAGLSGGSCSGVCSDGSFNIVCNYAGFSPPSADCGTGYNSGIRRVSWNVYCSQSGNHCAHLGGGDIIADVSCNTPVLSCVYIGSLYLESDGTVVVAGTAVTGSGGQLWTNCTHSCQFAAGNDVGQITIAGAKCNVDHVIDNTHLVLTSPCFANGSYGYSLDWYGGSNSYNVRVAGDRAGLGAQGGIQAVYLTGGQLDGSIYDAQGSGILCYSCNGVTIGANAMASHGANFDINGGIPYTTGTVTATAGSPIVIGVGTKWLSGAAANDWMKVATDTAIYAVLSVDSDTQITLTQNYAGAAPGGSAYRVAEISQGVHISGASRNSAVSNGVQITDCLGCSDSGPSTGNNAYGYADGGLSQGNLYSGLASGNVIGTTSISAQSWYTGKP